MSDPGLAECFEFFNISLSQDLKRKCEELCKKYCLDAEGFVDHWMAFAVDSIYQEKGPTLESLALMERKVLAGKDTPTKPSAYEKSNTESTPREIEINEPSGSQAKFTPQKKKEVAIKFDETPLSQIQESIPTSNYSERKDAGDKVLSFGSDRLLKKATFRNTNDDTVTIAQVGEYHMKADARYMYETLKMNSETSCAIVDHIADSIFLKNELGQAESSLNTMTIYGRIRKSQVPGAAALEVTNSRVTGKLVDLNLQNIKQYSIFPGQTVVVKGTNLKGSQFAVEQFYSDASAPLADIPTFKGAVEVVVASGPFTVLDNLSYEPLQDLLKYVAVHKPHILLLIGPFLDNRETFCRENTTDTYEEFFETLITSIMDALREVRTQVVVVASSKDLHHHVVYPTHPYVTRRKYDNLHLFSDPCQINIAGIVIGVTSVDILSHMVAKEECRGPVMDRVSRCCKHIIQQRSFYPFYPPEKDMSIDVGLLESYGIFDQTPHIMILPSRVKYFTKNIDGCFVLNPEKLTKYNSGGTFARMHIEGGVAGSFLENIACEILKI